MNPIKFTKAEIKLIEKALLNQRVTPTEEKTLFSIYDKIGQSKIELL